MKSILQYATSVKPSTLTHLSRVLAALTYGNKEKMTILTDHFNSVMDFESFDQDRKAEDEQRVSEITFNFLIIDLSFCFLPHICHCSWNYSVILRRQSSVMPSVIR